METRARTAVVALALFIAVTLGSTALPTPASAVTYRGETFVTLSCTGYGITWSGVTSNFYPNTRITYHWIIWRNGAELARGSHGGYYTNSIGNHWRLPSGFPQALDCGHGVYRIKMWTTNQFSTRSTYAHYDEAAC